MGDFDIETDPDHVEMDERMQKIMKQSAYEANKAFSGLLLSTILYRLLVDREFDRTLTTVLLGHVLIEVSYQLYYQWLQQSDLSEE